MTVNVRLLEANDTELLSTRYSIMRDLKSTWMQLILWCICIKLKHEKKPIHAKINDRLSE